jgi:hypothetical protein
MLNLRPKGVRTGTGQRGSLGRDETCEAALWDRARERLVLGLGQGTVRQDRKGGEGEHESCQD